MHARLFTPSHMRFFAAEELAPSANRKSVAAISVWAIKKELFHRNFRQLRRVTVPPGRVPFLDAQDGLFTWSPVAYEWLLRDGRSPTVEDLVEDIATTVTTDLSKPLLRKLTLRVEEVPTLLKLLWREQVTRAHLMPTFNNVTASMRLRATSQEELS